MAKAKRDRRTSIRNMSGDDAFETLDRLQQMEREQQAAAAAAAAEKAPSDRPETDDD